MTPLEIQQMHQANAAQWLTVEQAADARRLADMQGFNAQRQALAIQQQGFWRGMPVANLGGLGCAGGSGGGGGGGGGGYGVGGSPPPPTVTENMQTDVNKWLEGWDK